MTREDFKKAEDIDNKIRQRGELIEELNDNPDLMLKIESDAIFSRVQMPASKIKEILIQECKEQIKTIEKEFEEI